LQISVDGSTKEVFEKIRAKSNFEKVIDNCKLINDYGASVGKRRTKMWTVVQNDNIHQLDDLVKLGAELGFPSMVFSLDVGDWGQEEWADKNVGFRLSDFDDDEGLRLINLGKKLGIDVYFWYLESKYGVGEKSKLCPWPFERAYVSSDMRVVPCCMIANPDSYELGDASGGFESVWFSDTYKQFRKAHVEGRIPDNGKGGQKNSNEGSD